MTKFTHEKIAAEETTEQYRPLLSRETTEEKRVVSEFSDPRMYDFIGDEPVSAAQIERLKKSHLVYINNLPDTLHAAIASEEEEGNSNHSESLRKAIHLIRYAPENERFSLIVDAIAHSRTDALRLEAASVLEYVPEAQREQNIEGLVEAVRRNVSSSTTGQLRSMAASAIEFLPQDSKIELQESLFSYLTEVFSQTELGQRLKDGTIFALSCISEEQQAALRPHIKERVLKYCISSDPINFKTGVQLVKHAPREEIPGLIKKYLEYSLPIPDVVLLAETVKFAPESEQAGLQEIIGSRVKNEIDPDDELVNIETQTLNAERLINLLPLISAEHREFIQKRIVSLIRKVLLFSEKNYLVLLAFGLASSLPKEELEPIEEDLYTRIKDMLQAKGTSRVGLSKMIQLLSEEKRQEIYALQMANNEKDLKKAAVSTRLYDKTPKEGFRKHNFPKTGGRITLLDKVPGASSLKNKAIIRHVETQAYMCWYKAFASTELWKERQFDYVPIEPIIRVGADSNNLTAEVATKVLGPTIHEWIELQGPFIGEILDQKDAIIDTLKSFNLNHWDMHLNNFCLLFHRDEKGEVDLTKPPRVYAIDFDLATEE